MEIKGLNPEARVIEEETGGMHSELDYRLDLLLPKAIFRLGKILKLGADKGYPHPRDNKLSPEIHVNHALGHIFGWLMGDKQGDHLAHAFCRLMLCMNAEEEGEDEEKILRRTQERSAKEEQRVEKAKPGEKQNPNEKSETEISISRETSKSGMVGSFDQTGGSVALLQRWYNDLCNLRRGSDEMPKYRPYRGWRGDPQAGDWEGGWRQILHLVKEEQLPFWIQGIVYELPVFIREAMMATEAEHVSEATDDITQTYNVNAEFMPPLKSQEEDDMQGGDMEYIYICSPLSGDIKENVERVMVALGKLRREWTQKGKKMPLVLCPHTMFYGISFDYDGEDRKWGMEMCVEMVKLCDTMIVLGDTTSSGMMMEINEALRLNKKLIRRTDL